MRKSSRKRPTATAKPPAQADATKVPPPRNLTPALCDRLRRELLAACRSVAETHGLTIEGGELSDIDLRHGFGIAFRVGIPMADGAIFSPDKALFEALASSFGLQPTDYGRTFRTQGEAFRITAINPNRPKYTRSGLWGRNPDPYRTDQPLLGPRNGRDRPSGVMTAGKGCIMSQA